MTLSLSQRMTRGAAWMLLMKFVERSLGLVSTLILVRLLSPSDFGIVAMAISVIGMAELLTAFGFDVALIQRQDTVVDHYHSAWTCNLLMGAGISLLLLLSATPVAAFYLQPDLIAVVCVLALGPVLGGFENIGVVAFRKDLDFRKEFLFLTSKKLIAFSITVPLAFWLRSYWALVAGMVASRGAGAALSFVFHPFRPRFSLSHARDLFGFSKWILLNNVTVYLRERGTDFFLGRWLGPRGLGLFNVANEFSNLTLTELAAPLNRALMPAFAKIQHDRAAAASAFSASIGVLALVALPAAVGISAVAPHLVPVVLGGQWLEAVPLMEVLAVAGGLATFQSPICSILISHGRPDLVLRGHLSFIACLVIGLLVLVPQWQALGAAYAVLAAALLSTPVFLWMLSRTLGFSARALSREVLRPLLATVVMYAAVRYVVPEFDASASMQDRVLRLFEGVVLGVAVYVPTVLLLWRAFGCPAGAERFIFDLLKARLMRWRAA
jgi:lipopolysaccharide exporter